MIGPSPNRGLAQAPFLRPTKTSGRVIRRCSPSIQRKSGARYEHYLDFNGWRFLFLDTGLCGGRCDDEKWPFGQEGQVEWLTQALQVHAPHNVIFAHHSRLSWGSHGDNPGLQRLWELLFDAPGRPLVTVTIAGHDHDVSIYKPRDRQLNVPADPRDGIQIVVNGAGGNGHYKRKNGTPTDIYPKPASQVVDPTTYCITRITIDDAGQAELSVLSFGADPDSAQGPKSLIFQQSYPGPKHKISATKPG